MDIGALAGLGAFHGLNPAMGWLFAVALGLQQRSRGRLLGALGPIALGHAASVGIVAAVIAVADSVLARGLVLVAGGLGLIGFGAWHLVARRHLRWVGMQLGFRDLVVWSFLMSSVHGAGFMLLPVLAGGPGGAGCAGGHHHGGHGVGASLLGGLGAAGLHSAAMLLTMGAVAVAVYEVVGTDILRRAWFDLDRVWAFALIGAGLLFLTG